MNVQDLLGTGSPEPKAFSLRVMSDGFLEAMRWTPHLGLSCARSPRASLAASLSVQFASAEKWTGSRYTRERAIFSTAP
jgi:hypothetical protein